MQCATLLVGQIVTFVVRDEVDDCPIGERRRLIQNEATKRAHAATVRRSEMPGKDQAGLSTLRSVHVRRLAEEHFRRFHHRLGERRVRMDRQLKVDGVRTHLECAPGLRARD